MGKTKISWATYTNSVVTGCSKPAAVTEAGLRMYSELDALNGTTTVIDPKWLKPGSSCCCIRCYAETLSLRRGWSPKPWAEVNEDVNVRMRPERFRDFGKVKVKPVHLPPSERERFFVASMGDIFHRNVTDEFLEQLFEYLVGIPHIYMLLTKRIDRAASWPGPWPENVWLGTTCGHPITKWRLEYLRRSGARTRFVSMEPLLASMLPLDLTGIDQVIVGGESGSGFRPMKMQWAREVRDICVDQGKAFFYKQDAAYQTEIRPFLVEADGTRLEYHQFPGELRPPVVVGSSVPSLEVVG